jgi:hypothetical protein
LVTIDASDASGNPLASGLALAGSLNPNAPFADGIGASSPLVGGSSSSGGSLGGASAGSGVATVPEPSSIVLIVLGSLACLLPALRRGKARRS